NVVWRKGAGAENPDPAAGLDLIFELVLGEGFDAFEIHLTNFDLRPFGDAEDQLAVLRQRVLIDLHAGVRVVLVLVQRLDRLLGHGDTEAIDRVVALDVDGLLDVDRADLSIADEADELN